MSEISFEPITLPAFSEINTETLKKEVLALLKDCQETLSDLEKSVQPTWASCIKPLEKIQIKIHNLWSPLSHLHSVQNSPELREVYGKLIEPMTSFYLRMEQSEEIHSALLGIKEGSEFQKLTPTRKRILEKRLLQAELSGINLSAEKKKLFTENSKKLSQLSVNFSNNVLDAIKEFSLTVDKAEDMGKLPLSFKELTSEAFKKKFEGQRSTREKGPWLITLDHSCFIPFMENCPNRDLREKLYLASITSATEGKLDNTPLINEILTLRKSQAELLGYKSYAEVSLASKMAESVTQIYEMTDKLNTHARPKALEELEEIKNYSASKGGPKNFSHWDLPFWSERLREEKFDYEEDDLKPYFSFEKVTEGLFSLSHKLFQITIKENPSPSIDKWDKEVKYYEISNAKEEVIASFFLDPYTRAHNKRSGAWMNNCVDRRLEENGKITRPVAYLVCNFTPPTKEEPSLLTFDEVRTLFHEFGHGLQHMLTTIDDMDASGISGVEWDCVELPSQFMENWCYHEETLLNMAKHYKTGETLPQNFYQKIMSSKNYMAALKTLRQLHFALQDLHLHDDYSPEEENPFRVQHQVGEAVLVMKPHPKDRMLCRFSHIFAGGYSAGYYSYKWAEILSADAFSLFEENGLENQQALKEVGLKFKETVLGLGGSEDPMVIYEKFRGRKPTPEALLRHQGLL